MKRSMRFQSLGLLALASLLLNACNNSGEALQRPDEYVEELFRTANWRPSDRAPRNEVELVSLEHRINFKEGSAQFDQNERRLLGDFLMRSGIGRGDSVTIHAPRRDGNLHDPVTASRLGFLRGELSAMGIKSVVPLAQDLGATQAEIITVAVERSVVVSPDCAQPLPAVGNRPRFVMGCSNEVNLGLMVVDPLDIEQGRELTPADGEATTLSIQRYRAGEIRELESTEAETTN